MKYFYLLLFSVIPAVAFSQTNFQKGYIIKAAGDTVSGYIDNREWNINPDVIKFKLSTNDKKVVQYKAIDIKGFVISGINEYQSYTGYISMGKTQGTQLSSGIDTTMINASVFLKLLANGENVKLYAYTDHIKPRYFVQENNQQPTELKYSVFYSNKIEDTGILSTQIYKGQLSLLVKKYAPDNTKLNLLITRAEYSAVQLMIIVNTINNNKSLPVKSSGIPHFRLFVGAGFGVSKSKFDGSPAFATASSSNSTAPVFDAGIDFLPQPHTQRVIIRAEFLYTYANSNFEADHVGAVDRNTATIRQRTIAVLPQVIYNFYNSENVKIYAGLGLSANFSSYKTTKSVTVDTYTVNYNDIFDFNTAWISVPVEAGVILNKRLDIRARYLLPSDYGGGDYNVRVSSLQIGAHWLFGKH